MVWSAAGCKLERGNCCNVVLKEYILYFHIQEAQCTALCSERNRTSIPHVTVMLGIPDNAQNIIFFWHKLLGNAVKGLQEFI